MQNIGALIGLGTLARDLGGITIWSNGSKCNLEGQFWYMNLNLTSE